MAYTSKPATIQDGIGLAMLLTPADREELAASQLDPEDSILQGIHSSLQAISIFDRDGFLAGIAGVVPLDQYGWEGSPWLLTTSYCRTEPVSFVKQAKGWVSEQLQQFQCLKHQAYKRNYHHLRLLKMLGFKVGPEHPSSLFVPFELCAHQLPQPSSSV
jgi:hypothetical protein